MFEPLSLKGGRSHRGALLLSITIHVLLVYLLVRPLRPVFVTQSATVFGNHGTSRDLTYLSSSRPRDGDPARAARPLNRRLHAEVTRKRKEKALRRTEMPRSEMAETDEFKLRAGSPFGSGSKGAIAGFEERPALPVAFPDIPRSEIPPEVAGNVAVEITIDAEGNVVDTRVLESLGALIDDVAIRTLRQWHFRPAMRNGVAVASKQLAYFHLPR